MYCQLSFSAPCALPTPSGPNGVVAGPKGTSAVDCKPGAVSTLGIARDQRKRKTCITLDGVAMLRQQGGHGRVHEGPDRQSRQGGLLLEGAVSLAAGLCDPAELSRPVVRQPPRLDLELDRSPHRYFGPQLGSVYRHMKHRTRAGRPGFGNDDLVLSNLDPNSAQTHLLLQQSEIEDGQVQRLTTELLSPKAPEAE